MTPTRNQRRPKGVISPYMINYVHLRNPWLAACWSAVFPGFGHLFLCKNLKGIALIVWEILVNLNSDLNHGIIFTFLGRFDLAKEHLVTRWALLYVSVYFFAIWDSYRSAVDLNKLSVLADKKGSTVDPFVISPLDINYLGRRNPWVTLAWSALTPGLGHLYNCRFIPGFVILSLWIALVYFSHFLEAVIFTATGDFGRAAAAVDPQWLLFMPSVYGFALLDSYVNTVELKKMFESEQDNFWKNNYQHPDFVLPL